MAVSNFQFLFAAVFNFHVHILIPANDQSLIKATSEIFFEIKKEFFYH
jgi:hypothetical protein